jgi:uncharacterized membrane protein YphA (DoxX/SURF4 family)/peroxiredoxin
MDSFVVGAQVLLAAIFALAGGAKLSDREGSRKVLEDFGVPLRWARRGAIALPIAELLTAVAILVYPTARIGAAVALVLLLGFIAGVANAMRKGLDVDCGCFGRIYSATAGSATLVRNAVLAGLAAVVVIHGPVSISSWARARTTAELVAAVAIAVLVALAAAVWLIRRDRSDRRAKEELHAERARLPRPKVAPQGHPVGTVAPGFQLTNLNGETQTLDSLLARGRPVLLAFTDIGCGPCGVVLPDLARWRVALADRLTIAVLAGGEPDAVRSRWEGHGFENVLLDSSDEVLDAYLLRATPTAILVHPDGIVASAPSGGIHGLEVLVRHALRRDWTGPPPPAPAAPPRPTILTLEPGTA